MHDSHSDDDEFWGIGKSSPKASHIVAPSPVKKGDIKLSFSIPSLTTSPVSTTAFESTPRRYSPLSQSIDKIAPKYISPSTNKPLSYSNESSLDTSISDSNVEFKTSSLYPDEDKSDLHDILDALLNFESTIEPSNDVTLSNPYTHSLTQAPVDNYGNTSRRQEVERENSRLAKQIKQSKPCVVRSSHGQVSIIKSTAAPASINRTRLTRIEQENLNLLKRIQSAKTSKAISRREHERHYESHKVYGKISSKQRSLDSSPGIKSMSNLSKPEWIA